MDAPECIGDSYSFSIGAQGRWSPRDIYSFGLLSSYIALDGQTPKSYTKNLEEVKLSDDMTRVIKTRLEEHHSSTLDDARSLGNLVAQIADMTLSLDPDKREKHLGGIRRFLFERLAHIRPRVSANNSPASTSETHMKRSTPVQPCSS